MTSVDYSWSGAREDFELLLRLREARERFFDEIGQLADPPEEFVDLADRHGDAIVTVAEFMFGLKALGATTPDALLALVRSHNAHLDDLLSRPEHRGKVGGRTARLQEGRFPEAAIAFLRAMLGRGPFELSQSDIARFLVEVLSAETCRKVVAGLGAVGLLEIREEPINRARMIRSHGYLEAAFGRYLNRIRVASDRGSAGR